jgi:hypothetical protein
VSAVTFAPIPDRRKHPRVPPPGSVEILVETWTALAIHNVSMGGLRVSLPRRPRVGDRFQVTLKLPFGRTISLRAEVRNVGTLDATGPCVVGLRWIDIAESARDHEALHNLVAAAAIERETQQSFAR